MEIIRRSATAPKKPLYEIEIEEYLKKPVKGMVATADSETCPFVRDRVVKPFTCGFWIIDEQKYVDFWGDDCIDQMFAYIEEFYPDEDITFFVHNGGNFDFYFMTEHFDEGMSPFIINGRLVRVTCKGKEFRDSYAMIPVALGNALKAEDGGKIEINYGKFERSYPAPDFEKMDDKLKEGVKVAHSQYVAESFPYQWLSEDEIKPYSPREYFKPEIRHYQKQDNIALGALVSEWLEMFGNRLTMASVALPMLRSFHGFESMPEHVDDSLRPYYFGGRCQAFETGVIHGNFKGYDITSSYPDVMRRLSHPISDTPLYEKRITSRTHFARIRAWSNGALPIRKENGGLDFPIGTRDFFACIHEIKAGLETGTLRIHHVYESIYFTHMTSFDEFIDTFYKLRLEASDKKDEVKKLFYKLVMNSSYGKFAQDPRKYESWLFDPPEIPSPVFCETCFEIEKKKLPKPEVPCAKCESGSHDAYGWYLHTVRDGKHIYAHPQKLRNGSGFFNVACAASITSAARASLLYGINSSVRPLYCDTDSLICESFSGDIDNRRLGAWKFEFDADEVCIAGKKLYAVFDKGVEVKKASKGVRLEADDIRRICEGEMIEYANPVPKFKLNGDVQFVTRKIRKTGKAVEDEEHIQARSFRLV